MATLTLPPIDAQTTLPLIALSWPSMVIFVPPGDAAALDDSDAEELALELAELDDGSDFFSDEQPETPAIRIAAPPTATSNPRFTTVLLLFCAPSRSAGHLQQYGALLTG
jgi:hypothetical protein